MSLPRNAQLFCFSIVWVYYAMFVGAVCLPCCSCMICTELLELIGKNTLTKTLHIKCKFFGKVITTNIEMWCCCEKLCYVLPCRVHLDLKLVRLHIFLKAKLVLGICLCPWSWCACSETTLIDSKLWEYQTKGITTSLFNYTISEYDTTKPMFGTYTQVCTAV